MNQSSLPLPGAASKHHTNENVFLKPQVIPNIKCEEERFCSDCKVFYNCRVYENVHVCVVCTHLHVSACFSCLSEINLIVYPNPLQTRLHDNTCLGILKGSLGRIGGVCTIPKTHPSCQPERQRVLMHTRSLGPLRL